MDLLTPILIFCGMYLMLICVSLSFFEGEGLSMKGTARWAANLEMELVVSLV